MVHRGLHDLPWRELDYLFIENVGNLVCPAVYDLGQAVNVVALAVTEGEDKPLKYPVMFRKADLVLVTKIDLLPHLPGVRIEAITDALGAGHAESGFLPDLGTYRRRHAGLARVVGAGAASADISQSRRNRSPDDSRQRRRKSVASS